MVRLKRVQSILTIFAALGLCVLAPGAVAQLAAATPHTATGVSVSDSQQDLLASAKEAEQKRDFDSAAAFYRQYLKTTPDDAQVLQRLGLVESLSNHFDAAIPPLSRALKLDPTLWGSALYLGISYYRTAHFKEALPVLQQSLRLKPGIPETQFWLGCALVANGQPESSISHLLEAQHDRAWEVQAQDLLVKAYRAAAEQNYHRIAAVAPDSERVHLVKAQTLEWKGVSNEAVWEARQALHRDPNLEGAHRIIGEVYWQEKGFDLAAKEFQSELAVSPLDGESNLRMGEYWLAKGDAHKAGPYLDAALHQGAGQPGEANHFLGEAALAERNYAVAVADLQRAIAKNPNDTSTHELLARVYRARGQLDLAASEERLARSVPASAPTSVPESSPNP